MNAEGDVIFMVLLYIYIFIHLEHKGSLGTLPEPTFFSVSLYTVTYHKGTSETANYIAKRPWDNKPLETKVKKSCNSDTIIVFDVSISMLTTSRPG